MKLLPEWRAVLRHAWSVRLMLLACLLSAAEAVLPIINETWVIPPLLYLFLLAVATAGGLLARVIVQQGITPAGTVPPTPDASTPLPAETTGALDAHQ